MMVIIAVICGNCRGNYWTKILKTGGRAGRWLRRRRSPFLLLCLPACLCPLLIFARKEERGIIALATKVTLETNTASLSESRGSEYSHIFQV